MPLIPPAEPELAPIHRPHVSMRRMLRTGTGHGQTDIRDVQMQPGVHPRGLIDLHDGQANQPMLRQSSDAPEDGGVSRGERGEGSGMRGDGELAAFENLVPDGAT